MLVLLLATLLAGSSAGLAVPALLGWMVDAVDRGNPPATLAWGAAALLTAGFLTAVLSSASTITMAHIGQNGLADLREEVFATATARPSETLERAGSGDLLSRVSHDVEVVNEAIGSILPTFMSAAFTVALTMAGLGAIDPRFALAALLSTPIHWFALRRFLRASGPLYREVRVAESERGQRLLEATAGADTVRALGHSQQHLARIGRSSVRAIRLVLSTVVVRTRFQGRLNIAELVGLCSILGVGYWLVGNGSVSVGAATAAALFFHRLFGPIGAILMNIDDLQLAGAGLSRLVGIIDGASGLDPSSAPGPARTAHSDRASGIELRGVSAGYLPGKDVLTGLDLHLRAGEHVTLVGASGAGKTTLARVIAGSLQPTAGTVSWHGVPYGSAHDAPGLGRSSILVSQDVHVFSGTIADNLRLAAPGASDDALHAALTAAGADWVAELPARTRDSRRRWRTGATGDRAQHLALVRALLSDQPVVVLDEATAEDGSMSSHVLEQAAVTVARNRTTVSVAHRLSQQAAATGSSSWNTAS
ncbi:ABC transporter ATP-binding protein [Aeromicrobium sp. UC242_57]|uniref:ABC transporter ATP-binding protein n=1 Tax=Aeromicrobium sp. UC242_57 TaxID=3374624 RepID=UPI00379880E4